jgi:hypothetical protein
MDVGDTTLNSSKGLRLHSDVMTQAEVLERAEGIKREYNELDTVWFMAGSLFQVMHLHLLENNVCSLFFFLLTLKS